MTFKTWLFYHKTFQMYHISNMTVGFVRLYGIVSSYMKIGICQLINSCSLVSERKKHELPMQLSAVSCLVSNGVTAREGLCECTCKGHA